MPDLKLSSYLQELMRAILRGIRARILARRFRGRLAKLAGRKKIFYLMGLDQRFPNLGDQAMAAVIPSWIRRHFDGEIVELAFDEKFDYLPIVEQFIEADDLVFLQSGGNFGDAWPHQQQIREDILRCLRGHSIYQLPQTIFFSDTETGNTRLAASREAIEAHGRFTIAARDRKSADIARACFPSSRVLCYPDMALLLDPIVQERVKPRASAVGARRVLSILRADREGVLGQGQKENLQAMLKGHDVESWDTDPVIDVFPKANRVDTVLKYLGFVASFDAVVTDRFHGLIFSVLTRRPCVVMASFNHKIPAAFEWFRDIPFVVLANSMEEVPELLSRVTAPGDRSVPDWDARYFTPMALEFGGRA